MDHKMFDLLEKMYVEMKEGFNEVYVEMKEGFKEVNIRIENLENEVKKTKNKVILVEEEHGKKLDVLFDGYKQNADKLDRIENEVSKHEEIILRRVR